MPARLVLSRALDAAFRKLDGLGESVLAKRVLDNGLGRYERDQNVATFASEGDKSGERWAALSPRYARWKRRQVGQKNILQFSGALRRSLVQRGGERVERAERRLITLGTSHRLAPVHQTGFRGIVNVRPHTRQRGATRYQVQGYAYRQNLPPRPPVRKSATQRAGLRGEAARLLLVELARESRGTALGRGFAVAAGSVERRRPAAGD